MSLWQPPENSTRSINEAEEAGARARGVQKYMNKPKDASTTNKNGLLRARNSATNGSTSAENNANEQDATNQSATEAEEGMDEVEAFSPEMIEQEAARQKAAEAAKYGQNQ